ncbi:MAG: chalcone isomerase family protein [Betaproteobacteria bacterium]
MMVRALRVALRIALRVALVSFGLSIAASAAEIGGVKLDDKVTVGGQELVLNGAGVRTKVVFKIYVASLYLPQKSGDLQGVLAKAPRRIQLNMLRALSADQLTEALVDGLNEANTPEQLAAIKTQIDQMVSIMKAFKEVKEKDVVTLDYVNAATQVVWNGENKGSIAGEAFNQALSRVWLGDKPVQGDLRKAMLGG